MSFHTTCSVLREDLLEALEAQEASDLVESLEPAMLWLVVLALALVLVFRLKPFT
jgi:hypothetical protein